MEEEHMSIIITGSTGELGRLVIADLLASGVPADQVTAVARSEEKAADLVAQGVRLHLADYDRPETFATAFQPEDRVLLISGSDVGRRVPQHAVVIDAAKAAGEAQLAYTGVLCTDGHLNQAYELSGDTAWTFEEFAEEVSRQTGKKVVHNSLSAAEYKTLLLDNGLPEVFADILVDVDAAISRGALAATPGDLSRLVGRPTVPIADSIAAAL